MIDPQKIDEAAVEAVLPLKDSGLTIEELLELAELVKKTLMEYLDGKDR